MTSLVSRSTKGYKALVHAIILQACRDYRSALVTNNIGLIYDNERFFKSVWFMNMTNIDGMYLIERIKREVKNEIKTKSRQS